MEGEAEEGGGGGQYAVSSLCLFTVIEILYFAVNCLA